MLIERDLIRLIEPFLKRREFFSIIGPRQAGKTTFLMMLKSLLLDKFKIEEGFIKSVTFEDRKLLMEFEAGPVSFVRSFMPKDTKDKFYLTIDEFQYAENGGQKLKLIYDTVKNIKIIITGSSSLDLKANVGKFLVGRIFSFSLYPFNFREYLRSGDERLERIYSGKNELVKGLIIGGRPFKIEAGRDLFYSEFLKKYETFCIWGGYPEVALAGEAGRKKILSDIYNNYILKDIKGTLELATEKNLFLLSRHLATQIGSIAVYQNIGLACGLDFRNLKRHLNVLEETFVCREVRPFFRNRQKELSKNPKFYFLDMGFRNNLMENMNGLAMRSDAGAIVENTSFIRLNELCEGRAKINFWRTKAGAEVDFVLARGGTILPIEIKYSPFSKIKISKSLASFIDTFHPPIALVLTKDYWARMRRNKTAVFFIPVYYL